MKRVLIFLTFTLVLLTGASARGGFARLRPHKHHVSGGAARSLQQRSTYDSRRHIEPTDTCTRAGIKAETIFGYNTREVNSNGSTVTLIAVVITSLLVVCLGAIGLASLFEKRQNLPSQATQVPVVAKKIYLANGGGILITN